MDTQFRSLRVFTLKRHIDSLQRIMSAVQLHCSVNDLLSKWTRIWNNLQDYKSTVYKQLFIKGSMMRVGGEGEQWMFYIRPPRGSRHFYGVGFYREDEILVRSMSDSRLRLLYLKCDAWRCYSRNEFCHFDVRGLREITSFLSLTKVKPVLNVQSFYICFQFLSFLKRSSWSFMDLLILMFFS